MNRAGPDHTSVWLQKIIEGDEQAMREMYVAYSSRVHAFVRNYLRDPMEVQEVVVDTMFEVWKHAARFRGDSKFLTWLLGIARHKALSKVRARDPDHEELSPDLVDDSPCPEDSAFGRQQRKAVEACMDRLPAEQRECIYLVYFEELSLAEVASIQECPENTVKTRLFHARRKIKPCLQRYLESENQ